MTPQEFYAQYSPFAKKVSEQTGLDPRLVLAQAALETGYGKSAPGGNFFGIKSHGREGGNTLQTKEFQGGKMVSQPASFRAYDSAGQSFDDYADFLVSNPRYKDVLAARDLDGQIDAIGKSGYATDPRYAAKLRNIAAKFDPSLPDTIAADTMTAIGKGPRGILAAPEPEAQPMIANQQRQGLLGSLGVQKMQPGAEGETGQRFYERDTFKDTAARMAQGFAALGGNPAVQKFAADVAAQRTEGKARNKTVDYLRKAGRTDLADMVAQGLISGRDAAGAIMQQPKEQTPFSAIGKLQADLASGRIDKDQYEVALQSMAPTGMSVEVDADGNVRFQQGVGASSKPPSERQSTLALFGGLMSETMPEIARLESSENFDPAGLAEGVAARTGWIGNYFRTEEGQRYQGLARQWAEGVLRIQTGAAATQPEIERVMETYFPVPGDTENTVRQKSQQRDAFARSLVVASGGNLDAPGGAGDRGAIGEDAPSGGGPKRLKFNPETGGFE